MRVTTRGAPGFRNALILERDPPASTPAHSRTTVSDATRIWSFWGGLSQVWDQTVGAPASRTRPLLPAVCTRVQEENPKHEIRNKSPNSNDQNSKLLRPGPGGGAGMLTSLAGVGGGALLDPASRGGFGLRRSRNPEPGGFGFGTFGLVSGFGLRI